MRLPHLLFLLAVTGCTQESALAPDLDLQPSAAIALTGYQVSEVPVRAMGIASDGTILGYTAEVWKNGVTSKLPRETNRPPTDYYHGLAIAPNGMIVGRRNAIETVVWASPTAAPTAIPDLYGSDLRAINSSGTIVGMRTGKPFSYSPSQGLRYLTMEANSPWGRAMAVSENGTIGGTVMSSGGARLARKWLLDGTTVGLSGGGVVLGIRNDGNAVGAVNPSEDNWWFQRIYGTASRWSAVGVRSQVGPALVDPANRSTAAAITPRNRVVGLWNSDRFAGEDFPWTWYQGQVSFLNKPAGFERLTNIFVNLCATIVGQGRSGTSLLWRQGTACD